MQIFTQESETTSWGTFQDFDKSMSLSKLNAMRSIKSNEIVYLFGDPDTQKNKRRYEKL
ncbi:hypothetical protein [Campylobacter sp. LR196d]|uniref:hypothetical protein n=1 Tax=Campylobacter sp. LR196d TaxID=2593543 RepID=UPI001680DE9C|nr:hypothetical protein [Campylobacter sp. LR196d]